MITLNCLLFSKCSPPVVPPQSDIQPSTPNYPTTIIACLVAITAIALLCVPLFSPAEVQPNDSPSLRRYIENIKALYKNQPEVSGVWSAVKFIPPVFYEFNHRQHSHVDKSKELYFDEFFRFTRLGQRILIQGRPDIGKTTLVNRLTKEWSNKTEKSKIAECPLLLRVTMKELMRTSEQTLSLFNILSVNNNIMHIDEELEQYLSEPRNAESLCIIFDGIDEYPPAYSDPSNYIYKIIVGQQLSPATVIVLSRPEAYGKLFQTSEASSFRVYELTGFNSKGITDYVTENILDITNRLRFLVYLQNNTETLYQLCASPLHLAMLIDSFKLKNEFPLSLTEAYIKSLSKAIQREIARRNIAVDSCFSIELNDLSSLQECNQDLAYTLNNISRLAFDSFTTQNGSFNVKELVQTQFSSIDLQSYLPHGDSYGLLSPQYFKNEYGLLVKKFSFPHFVIQEFWAAFYVAVTRVNISDFEETIFLPYPMFLYFICGMHSSNTTVLHQIFEMLHQTVFWPNLLNDYIMCGLESGYSSQWLVDTYLQLHGNELNMNHLFPYPLQHRNVQSFINIVHRNITRIMVSQHSPALRPYIENRTDMFPNLNVVSIRFIMANLSGNVKYPFDFSDNLGLIFSRHKLRLLEWILPLDALFDQQFLDLLGGTETEIEKMNITVIGSVVGEVAKDFKIYANCNRSIKWESWSIMKLTPDNLIAVFTKFIDSFHKVRARPGHSIAHQQGIKEISIDCITSILLLDCQYIQILFEAFYKSSFYDITQYFSVEDNCHGDTISYASHVPGLPGCNLVLLNFGNHSGINQPSNMLYLCSGLVLEQTFDIKRAQVCTNKQLHTYSRLTTT